MNPNTVPAPASRRTGLPPHGRGRRAGHGGFALIEALIAILIFSLGTLGLLGLQVSMMRATSGAKYRADATYLANDLIGIMWADAGGNSTRLSAYRDCANHPTCKTWQDKVAATLPSGTATLTVCAISTDCAGADADVGRVTLDIAWTVPNETQHRFRTVTSINANALN